MGVHGATLASLGGLGGLGGLTTLDQGGGVEGKDGRAMLTGGDVMLTGGVLAEATGDHGDHGEEEAAVATVEDERRRRVAAELRCRVAESKLATLRYKLAQMTAVFNA